MEYPKLSDNFYLNEYFPLGFIEHMRIRHCMRMLDPRLVIGDQFLRNRFGSIIICDQKGYKYSGIRPLEWVRKKKLNRHVFPGLPTSMDSMHVFGCASDKKFSHATIDEVYEDAKKNEELYLDHYIYRIENPEHTRGKYKDWLFNSPQKCN